MDLQPWHFECKGKSLAGNSEGSSTLHIWRKLESGRAYCRKCKIMLTLEQTADCFREYK